GRLVPQKDLETLIRAVAGVPRNLRLCFVGDGPKRGELGRLCTDLGVDCAFAGVVGHGELPEILSRSRCFVLPSRFEGHPKALLEAMAAGLACVASDISGVRDLADGGG